MALVLKDRVKETSTTAGTGTLTLAGAVTGFQSFAAVGNGNTTYYAIADSITGDWEVGIGTYTSSGTTLSRTTVLSSSNGGSLVNFAANPKDVFVTYPSEKSVYEDASNVVNATSFGAITATSAALTTGTVSTTPASNTDIANKQYVDGLVTQGISYHEPVYVESPNTAGNLNATYNNGASGVGATLTNAGTQVALTVDGILMTVGKRVLIYNQTNQTQNGVYTVTTVGSGSTNWVLTRATDANTYGLRDPNALGYNDAFFVTNGDTGAGETYVCTTTGTITFGTTNITFAQISSAQVYTAGTGLNLSPATTFNISNTGVSASTYGSASAVPVFAVNAQGQITSVTNTNIAISGSAVSGNIAGSAGSVANALTAGSYLTSAGTFDGSAARTFAVDATSANTASKVVARDASGNFSAGTITATLSGAATSATTATNIAGGAANQIPYNTAAGTTSFITAPTTASTYLGWNGSAFTYSAISTPNAVTFNNGGAGAVSGTTFNGSAARTISYNTVGASPLAGSTSLTTTGTVTTGTWSGLFGAVSGANLTSLTAGNLSGTIPSAVLGNSTAYVGTTAVALNRASANQALTGILSATMPGSTSGSVQVIPAAVAGTGTVLTLPATTGTAITSGDTGTVTNTMLAGSIADTKLSTISTAGKVSNSATTATNANTASAIVARDASGNFSAGTITAALSGNATTATSATSATTATNVAGGVAGAIHYQSAVGTTGFSAAGTSGQVLTSSGTTAPTWTTATSANTASAIVQRDASGNFSAGTITATLSGNATTSSSTTGNAATATTLQTARTINGTSFNGSANITITANTTNTLTLGSYLTGTSFNGSAAVTAAVDATTAATASKVVARDASGYVFAVYYNASGTFPVTASANTSGMATFTGTNGADNYGRGYTAAAAAALLSGQTMNINGSSTSCSGNAATATSATSATSATTATTATTANALNTGNNYQVNSLGVGTAGSGTAGEIRATNAVTAYYSDDRLKTKLGNIEGALAKVKTLSGFYYEANETAQALGYKPKREVGVSAQSVQAVLPEVVVPAPIDEQYLTVHYDKLVPLLIEAIKELEAKVAALEAKG